MHAFGSRLARSVVVVTATLALVATACTDSSDDAADSDNPSGSTATPSTTAGVASGDPLLVTTDLGDVQGTASEVDGVRAFLGVPYAAEPTGDNAWRAPQPRDPYEDVLDATSPGGACPQNPDDPLTALTPMPDHVDDCLTVSVWAPEDAAGLPVMVWFHGGGFSSGSAESPFYIGDDLAAEGVVVVGVNYRLGPFGFLALDELADESGDGSFGNYGLQDQQAALEWVQGNAEAFGGDPDNVTIFGESAGGASVCGHLASPASEGLFTRAIIQSGGGCEWMADPDEAFEQGAAFLETAGCADVACLRDQPTADLAGLEFRTGLVRDGVVLDESAATLAERGDLDDVPIVIGSNGTEMNLFTLSLTEMSDDELVELFAEVSADPEALLALYPAEDYESNLERYRTMLTEASFVCPALEFAEGATGEVYVYHYLWDSPNDPFGVGPTHGAELVPLFGHPEGIAGLPANDPDDPAQDPDRAVSDAVQEAWSSFATYGQPGDSWEAYREASRITIIDDDWELVDEIRDGRCPEVLQLANQEFGPSDQSEG